MSAKPVKVSYSDGTARRRKTARWRGSFRQVCNRLARSVGLYRSMRWLIGLVLLSGLCLVSWGMIVSVGSFATDANTLVNVAGDGGSVVDATLGFVQSEVLGLVGLAPTRSAADEALPPNQQPQVAGQQRQAAAGQQPEAAAASAPTPGWEKGFLPYQIPVASAASEHAPAVPMIPISGRSSPPTQAPTAAAPPADAAAEAQAAAPTAEPVPTATPLPPADPERLVIPSIGLDAPVVLAAMQTTTVAGEAVEQWEAPNFFAAGWQQGSARLGEVGNTVLNGHHNIYGEVFSHLRDLQQGDEIQVYSGDTAYRYVVSQVMKLRERDMPLDQRLENARWVLPSEDQRLTLVTCWPPISNTYRLIVVAVPAN